MLTQTKKLTLVLQLDVEESLYRFHQCYCFSGKVYDERANVRRMNYFSFFPNREKDIYELPTQED